MNSTTRDPMRSLLPTRLIEVFVLGVVAVPGLLLYAWWEGDDPWWLAVLACCLFAALLAAWEPRQLAAHVGSAYPRPAIPAVVFLATGLVGTVVGLGLGLLASAAAAIVLWGVTRTSGQSTSSTGWPGSVNASR